MFKVVGCWEFGWNAPVTEYELWCHPLRDFGAREFIMVPISGIRKKVTEYPDIGTAIAHNPDLTLVFVDEAASCPLPEFEHPEKALYVLGKAGYSPLKSSENEGLEVAVPTIGKGGRLWPHQAIAIVLYDRMLK